MKWPTFIIRYWDHFTNNGIGRINDCWGNSHKVELKARTHDEARAKFYGWHRKNRKGTDFPRIHSIG